MPLGAVAEAAVNAVVQFAGEMGSGAIQHYFGWKGCMIALLGIVCLIIGLYFALT